MARKTTTRKSVKAVKGTKKASPRKKKAAKKVSAAKKQAYFVSIGFNLRIPGDKKPSAKQIELARKGVARAMKNRGLDQDSKVGPEGIFVDEVYQAPVAK